VQEKVLERGWQSAAWRGNRTFIANQSHARRCAARSHSHINAEISLACDAVEVRLTKAFAYLCANRAGASDLSRVSLHQTVQQDRISPGISRRGGNGISLLCLASHTACTSRRSTWRTQCCTRHTRLHTHSDLSRIPIWCQSQRIPIHSTTHEAIIKATYTLEGIKILATCDFLFNPAGLAANAGDRVAQVGKGLLALARRLLSGRQDNVSSSVHFESKLTVAKAWVHQPRRGTNGRSRSGCSTVPAPRICDGNGRSLPHPLPLSLAHCTPDIVGVRSNLRTLT